jgi:hypothetical protein
MFTHPQKREETDMVRGVKRRKMRAKRGGDYQPHNAKGVPLVDAVADAEYAAILAREPSLTEGEFWWSSKGSPDRYSFWVGVEARNELMWRLHAHNFRWAHIARYMGMDNASIRNVLTKDYGLIAGGMARRTKIEAAAFEAKMREKAKQARGLRTTLIGSDPSYRCYNNPRIELKPLSDGLLRKRAEERRLWATIPDDTRGLTARLAGDPLPGRSALDQRRAA